MVPSYFDCFRDNMELALSTEDHLNKHVLRPQSDITLSGLEIFKRYGLQLQQNDRRVM